METALFASPFLLKTIWFPHDLFRPKGILELSLLNRCGAAFLICATEKQALITKGPPPYPGL